MKKVIGVMPLWDEDKNSLWMVPGYLDGVREAGGLPLILPLTEDPDEIDQLSGLCDGFLFTGGHDVDPALYGEVPVNNSIISCAARDVMEKYVLDHALSSDKPVLGICRGIQFINAALGGTLYQDLPVQHPSDIEHHMVPPYDREQHKVSIISDTPLAEVVGVKSLGGKSKHHQAVNQIAPDLRPMAVSPDGLTEAVYMPSRRFVWGVQWHPEFSYRSDESARRIFRAFVVAC